MLIRQLVQQVSTFVQQRLVPNGNFISRVNFQSKNWMVIFAFVLCIAAVISFMRGFSSPLDYPLCQWFTTYAHGFIKRGLMGTLASNAFHLKSGPEIKEIVTLLSTAILFFKLVCLGFMVRAVLVAGKDEIGKGGSVLVIVSWVFVTSSYLSFTAHTNGFFDHVLEIMTMGCIWAVYKRWYWLIPIFSIIALATHEMFVAYGFPIVFAAILLQLFPGRKNPAQRIRGSLLKTVLILFPIALFILLMIRAQGAVTPEMVDNIQEDAIRRNAMPARCIQNMGNHLEESIADSWQLQRQGKFFLERLTSDDVVYSVYPALVFLLIVGGWLLLKAQRAIHIVIFAGAVVSPLMINLIAWDFVRFANFTLFNGYVYICAVLLFSKPKLNYSRYSQLIMILLGLGISANSFVQPVILMADKKDGVNLLLSRKEPMSESFFNCKPVFANSTFDMGSFRNWTRYGDAFDDNNKTIQKRNDSRGSIGKYWLSSYSFRTTPANKVIGDTTTGKLVSGDFEIIDDSIIFLIGGGKYTTETYVAIFVDDREICRASGENRDLMQPHSVDLSGHRGKTARIEIVDEREGGWGHINADQFCWSK